MRKIERRKEKKRKEKKKRRRIEMSEKKRREKICAAFGTKTASLWAANVCDASTDDGGGGFSGFFWPLLAPAKEAEHLS